MCWIFSSVQSLCSVQSCLTLCDPMDCSMPGLPSITNSWSLLNLISIELGSHPTVSSSVVPFSCLQSFPASGSFPMSQLFAWGGQSTGVSALASFLPKKSKGWPPLEWIGWISLQSKGLSRVFSTTTVQKHQFFGAQLSLQSKSHTHPWLLEKLALIRQNFLMDTYIYI